MPAGPAVLLLQLYCTFGLHYDSYLPKLRKAIHRSVGVVDREGVLYGGGGQLPQRRNNEALAVEKKRLEAVRGRLVAGGGTEEMDESRGGGSRRKWDVDLGTISFNSAIRGTISFNSAILGAISFNIQQRPSASPSISFTRRPSPSTAQSGRSDNSGCRIRCRIRIPSTEVKTEVTASAPFTAKHENEETCQNTRKSVYEAAEAAAIDFEEHESLKPVVKQAAPHLSHRVLQRLLQCIDEDATRQQLQAEVDSVLDITTPYGKLVETEAEANV